MNKNFKKAFLVVLVFALITAMSGCAFLDDLGNRVKGQLVGQRFDIGIYDNYGNQTMTVSGTKVTLGLLENSANFDTENNSGFKSEVLEITVNGNQMFQVGNTIICAERGVNMVTDFKTPKDVTVSNGGGFVPFDRVINDFTNKIGKAKTIVVSSQLGIPIGVYQGDEVYVTVPSDLPKTTRISIDGKSLYIHRANYVILDTAMLKAE